MSHALSEAVSEQVRSNAREIRIRREGRDTKVALVVAKVRDAVKRQPTLTWDELEESLRGIEDVRSIDIRLALSQLRAGGEISISTAHGVKSTLVGEE